MHGHGVIMPSNTYPFIAREGWGFLAGMIVIVLIVYLLLGWFAMLAFVLLFLPALFLFRDPPRRVPSNPLGLVSPVHGEVVLIDSVEDKWLKRHATRVRLRMSSWDIYSLRSPVEGKIMDQRAGHDPDHPGIRQYAFWIKTDEGDDVIVSIRMGWLPQRLRLYVQCGERLGQGQRCGYIYLGGEVDLWLPENFRIEVEPGDRVQSGAMLIGKLVHRQPASI